MPKSPSRRNSYIDVGIPSPLQDINSDTSIIKSFDVSTQNNSTTNLDQNGFVSIDNSSATALDTSSERDSYIKPTTEESDAEILKSDFDRYGFKRAHLKDVLLRNIMPGLNNIRNTLSDAKRSGKES